MEKFLYFSTGSGTDDLQNLDGREVALYKATDLITMRPSSIRTIDLHFKAEGGSNDVVTLGIKGGQHNKVLRSIGQAIATENNANTIISIADMDNYRFINDNIWSVSIKHQYLDVLKLNSTNKTSITRSSPAKIQSLTVANYHDSDTVILKLWLADQTGNDIVDTGTDSNESNNAATVSSVTLTVDGTAATSDVFTGEKIWKSDGTLFGTCSARNSNTEIVFAIGLEQTLANNDSLYVGKRYHLAHVNIYPLSSLVLSSDEINYDTSKYILYALVNTADRIDLTMRY